MSDKDHAPNFWIKHILYFDNTPVRTLDPDDYKDRGLMYDLKDRGPVHKQGGDPDADS